MVGIIMRLTKCTELLLEGNKQRTLKKNKPVETPE
jgi:hypothetical protein